MGILLNASNKTLMYLSELWKLPKEFVYLPCEVQTHTIIATRAERANSHKLSRAGDDCGSPIGLAVPSKALLVSFSVAAVAVMRRRSECCDRLRRRKICENSVFSHVGVINLHLQPILDKKVSSGPLLERARNAPFWHTCVT